MAGEAGQTEPQVHFEDKKQKFIRSSWICLSWDFDKIYAPTEFWFDCGVCVCVCARAYHVYICVCNCRMGQNVPKGPPVAGTILVDSQQPVLQDEHTYSSVDETQEQMAAMVGNPAYKIVPELSQEALQEDDRAYSNIDISQQEDVVISEKPKHGTTLGAAASAKWRMFFLHRCQQVSCFPEWE